MTDINFNITGIENLIEDLKKTRCVCDCVDCTNNSAHPDTQPISLPASCQLRQAWIGITGICEYGPGNRPKSEMLISPQAVEASVKGQDLLNRVSNVAVGYLRTEGRCEISESLLNEIIDHLGKPEE